MDNNKDSWASEKIFRISLYLSFEYIQYTVSYLQFTGLSKDKIIDYFINDYFYNLKQGLEELENSAIKLSVKQQEIIKNYYKEINHQINILPEKIQAEAISKNKEPRYDLEFNKDKLPLYELDESGYRITIYDQLIQERLELESNNIQESKRDDKVITTLELYFNIDSFILDIKELLSKKNISYFKQIAYDLGLSKMEYYNNIYELLFIECNQTINYVDKHQELTMSQHKIFMDLINKINSFKENMLQYQDKIAKKIQEEQKIQELQELDKDGTAVLDIYINKLKELKALNPEEFNKKLFGVDDVYNIKKRAKNEGVSIIEYLAKIFHLVNTETNENLVNNDNQEASLNSQKFEPSNINIIPTPRNPNHSNPQSSNNNITSHHNLQLNHR